jgi:hypothetical protein
MRLLSHKSYLWLGGLVLGTIVILLVILGLGLGCKRLNGHHAANQGVVVFDIEYVKNSGRNIPVQFLPKVMELKFNKHYASYSIEDRLGLFAISNQIDLKKHLHVTMVKVFDKKYAYVGTDSETSILFNSELPYVIQLLKDTMTVAGFSCNKALATNSINGASFDVLYFKDSRIENPNLNTPYRDVDGLLLKFTLQLKNIDMNLTAKEFIQKEIGDSIFEIPDEYKRISKKQMEEIVMSLLP